MSVRPKTQFTDEKATLDINEQDGRSDQIATCPVHTNTTLEYFCYTCNKSACKQCNFIRKCLQDKHIVNQVSNEIKLRDKIKFCIKAINNQEKEIIKNFKEKSKELISELEKIYNEKEQHDSSQVKDIGSNLAQVYDMGASGKNLTDSGKKGAENDTVTKAEPFEVSSLAESDASQLAATRRSATQGDRQLETTDGVEHVESPEIIKVDTFCYIGNLEKGYIEKGYIELSLQHNQKPEQTSINLTISNNNKNGTNRCGEKLCELCDHINSSTSSITGPNKKVFVVRRIYSCKSKNVIYAITCAKRCPKAVYIGQTNNLRQRMNAHKKQINDKKSSSKLVEHFNSREHDVSDFRFAVLMEIGDTKQRRAVETTMIKVLNCRNEGLNAQL